MYRLGYQDLLKSEMTHLRWARAFRVIQLKFNKSFTASYVTHDIGFIQSLSDATCPHEANWVDYYQTPITPGLLFRPCPTNKGRRIETIDNQSGTKKYREVFDAQSFSQLSTSVASSSTSCALACRRLEGCQSFTWTSEDNRCRMGGLVTDTGSGEGDRDPVFIETLGIPNIKSLLLHKYYSDECFE